MPQNQANQKEHLVIINEKEREQSEKNVRDQKVKNWPEMLIGPIVRKSNQPTYNYCLCSPIKRMYFHSLSCRFQLQFQRIFFPIIFN